MSAKGGVPDAWDDDWVNAADNGPASDPTTDNQPPAKLSKNEKRKLHAEQQRQLWDTAENPGRNLWLETQGVVPLKQEFKAPPTLLSRKPPTIAKKNVTEGVGGLSIDDGDDSEEEARKKREADFEERQRKAKLEREEKQKRYAEARERIMGSGNSSTASASRESSHNRDTRRTRGNKANVNNRRSQTGSPAENSPARQQPPSTEKQLFDPEDMGRRFPKRDGNSSPLEGQPVRQPRGPENSGRGGFGFMARGGAQGI